MKTFLITLTLIVWGPSFLVIAGLLIAKKPTTWVLKKLGIASTED